MCVLLCPVMEVFFTTIILLTLYCKTHSGLLYCRVCTTYGQQGALPNGDRRGVPNEYDDEIGVKIKLKLVCIFLFGIIEKIG